MATVIDQLIVKLGLDPRDFTKGEKQVAASVLKTKDSVKRSSQEMGQEFAKLATKWLSVAAAIALIKKLVGALADVSTQTRQLGIDSQNFNIATHKLRNFQNAVEMLGGKAEDVTNTIMGLQKAVFDLTVMGQSSASLEMLTRLGVQFQDATGHARAFEDIVNDTADALERAQKNGTLNRTEAFFAAKQAGFDDGTARLILSGRQGIAEELAKQQSRHQVNAEDIGAAEKIERVRNDVDQMKTSAAIQANTVAVATAKDAQEIYQRTVERTTDAMEGLANAVDNASGSFNRWSTRSMTPEQRERTYRKTVQESAKRYGVPYSVLHGVIKTESNYNPSAKSAAGAVGIAQFMPATARERGFVAGVNPKRDIAESARYLRDLYSIAARRAKPGEDPWALALQYYNAGTGRVAKSRMPGGRPLTQEAIQYPEKVLKIARQVEYGPTGRPQQGAAGNTTVNVGPVTINTQATDANGIANDMKGAVQRKMNVAQAEPGMR
jgi:soluble lytic murein transglycosylase-like protein